MARKLTTEEFIVKARNVHGNKYDYTNTEYKNAKTKVIITCPTHGDFEQLPNAHLKCYGCRKCSGKYRPTTEEFIEKSKSLWGKDAFGYSKVNYINHKTNVILICKKHNIDFQQFPSNHLKGQIGCSLCVEEIYGSKPSGYWTYEKCYEIAKKYEWLSDFSKQEASCCNASRKNNWLKDFTWLKRNYDQDEDIITAKKHLIYKYEFSNYNAVYIGLTMDLEKRHKRGHCKRETVYNFCKTNNIDVPKPQIIEDNLTLDEAKIREGYWIDYYREQGYNLLNKAKAGSVGTLCRIKTGKETDGFIRKAKEVHRDKYGYSKVKYTNNYTKVIITCPIHGEFLQSPSHHIQGKGCPKCGKERNCEKLRSTKEEFIIKSRSIHGDKYDYSNVVYKNHKTNVIITCLVHGKFEQQPNSHLQGCGCPKCGINKRSEKRRTTKEQFIERAKVVHGDRYDYSKVGYINKETKITITCPQHGDFEQTPANHLSGKGCSKCSGVYRPTTEEFNDRVREIHGNKYDYSKVVYKDNKTKVIINCPTHGDFEQIPYIHLQGSGCPKCGIENVSGKRRATREEFIAKARRVHGDKYGYSLVEYVNDRVKVILTCTEHGDFLQTPSKHLQGSGCAKCANERKSEKRTKWTYETCKVESMKYKSRGDFQKGSISAYRASWKNKWLDEFFPKK